MHPESIQAAAIAVAQERRVEVVLSRIAAILGAQRGVALARLWLTDVGDICERCPMAGECSSRERCLHLVASAGSPLATSEDWTRIDGAFRRFPLGVHKIGRAGATGTGILLHDMSARSSWIVHPEWAAREGIRSFAAQPLVFRSEVLGVLAVFSRTRIDAEAFSWLRAFADHAAVALANARAFEEVERLRARLEVENAYLRKDARGALAGGDVVGESAAVRKTLEQIDVVAPTDAAVLILGESGTGKEILARRVHERSRRAGGAFIKVSRAATPPELFESELFGHVRGASAGGLRDRAGRFEAADGGTLFLDEVGEIPLGSQAKLVRVLQEGTLERVGESRTRRVDVRLVTATTRDLAAEVAAGRFREDLYFRLNLFPILVPPLRERPGDVGPLADHFLWAACARLGRPRMRLGNRDRRRLERYAWPGNVRELASVVERAATVATDGRLRIELPSAATGSIPPADDVIPAADWRRRERANLEAALRQANGRIYGPGGAAELLGVPPTTFASRLKALGVGRPPAR